MCASFWSVHATFTCPRCGALTSDDLQTHWLEGHMERYELGVPIPKLAGIERATIHGEFSGRCDACREYMDFSVRIEDGAVVRAWPA